MKPEAEPQLEPPGGERAEVLQLYEQCLLGERHFNDLQSVYRRIVGFWLIAAFTAVGFVASKEGTWPVDRVLITGVIFMASSLGLWLLWCIDLLVYQRLLDSHFFEALRLEEDHKWLPRIHSRMVTLKSKAQHRILKGWELIPDGNVRRAAVFYSVPTVLFLVLAVFCIFCWLARNVHVAGVPASYAWPVSLGPVSFVLPFDHRMIALAAAVLLFVWPLRKIHRLMCNLPRNTEDGDNESA